MGAVTFTYGLSIYIPLPLPLPPSQTLIYFFVLIMRLWQNGLDLPPCRVHVANRHGATATDKGWLHWHAVRLARRAPGIDRRSRTLRGLSVSFVTKISAF